MADSIFEKVDEEHVRITNFKAEKILRSKEELEVLKLKIEAELIEIDKALEVFK